MNYDAQQYAFSHGLATTPQLQLQQHQLHQQQQQQQQHFKQQQQIFQQQYSQAVPTSNVYQFHFAGGCGPVNSIYQQKEAHPMGVSGNVQSRMAPHNMLPQPFIKQGVPMGIDGGSIHVVGSLNGMIYSQPKNNIKIITNPDGRLMQQPEGAVRMQQALVGVDVMGTSNFIEQSLEAQQHQSMRVAGQSNMFTYNKQHFPAWLQPQVSTAGAAQHTTGCQSTLPSFSHIWSQFPHQKQIDVIHQQQQQHVNQFQQLQQHQLQSQQHQIQSQQHFTAPGFQTLPGIQVINMQQQKPHQNSVPVSVHTVSHLPQQFNCFSPSQPKLLSPGHINKNIQNTERGMQCLERSSTVSSQLAHSLHCSEPSSCNEHQPSTAVTYTISGPPKVTVTLDSLAHQETLSPHQLPGRPESSFNSDCSSPTFLKGKAVEILNSSSPSLLHDNCMLQSQQEWQISHLQRSSYLPKPLLHTSSTGSSFERSSSESSNFSSPPYTLTPPSSIDSVFSLAHTQFPKAAAERSSSSSSSSGRTSAFSTSSSLMSLSSSPPVSLCMSSWSGSQSTCTSVPTCTSVSTCTSVPTLTAASSLASSTCTTLTSTVVFSCNTSAITTTSVTSTTPSPKESTCIASVHSGLPLSSTSSCLSETHSLSCSPVQRPSTCGVDEGASRKVQVPYSWHRKCENGIIFYLSPSGTVLHSFEQICRYLLSDSTCKCGLECPIQVETFFSFDPEVESQPWTASSSSENLGNLCNHRREVIALAAFHNSQTEIAVNSADQALKIGKKRERKKSINVGEGLIVSPLKRLKTSITNAVNKHAMSAGHGTCHMSTAGKENPTAVNMGLSFHMSSQSCIDSKGHCSDHDILAHNSPTGNPVHGRSDHDILAHNSPTGNPVHGRSDHDILGHNSSTGNPVHGRSDHDILAHNSPTGNPVHGRSDHDILAHNSPTGNPVHGRSDHDILGHNSSTGNPVHGRSDHDILGHNSPTGNPVHGRLDCQNSQFCVDDNEAMPRNKQVQSFSDHDDNKQTFLLHKQFHDSLQHPGNSGSHTFMAEEDPLVFHQGRGQESATGMLNHYSLDAGFQASQHQMQYPQIQLPHHHRQPQTNQGMFFPQSHAYSPNMPHVTHQRPQGFHPGMWHDNNPSGQAAVPHPHHHPPYPSNLNFQHSNFNQPLPGTFHKHTSNQQPFGSQTSVGSTKAKSKRPKSKKDKQKQINSIVDRSSPCLKASMKPVKTAVKPSTKSASFFGNPIVFVEQQTAMINNSIASCHITCPSPSPPQPDELKPIVIYQPIKETVCENKTTRKPHKLTKPQRNTSLEDLDKNGSSDKDDKDEEEDQKTGTDLDSNKSFSDTTENNDSAYLSQTGSDQERSDMTDCLDSCLETMSKSSDIYYFNSSENQQVRKTADISHTNKKSAEVATNVLDSSVSKIIPAEEPKLQQKLTAVATKAPSAVTRSQESKATKQKLKQRTTQVKREVLIHDIDLLKKNMPSNLNGEMSLLLASNNWNIPALQKVLAQYSGGDSDQLNAAVQQIRAQAMGTGEDFPASNLLSAAARAQLNLRQKEQVSVLVPHRINTPVLVNSKTDIVPASQVSSPPVNDSKTAFVSAAVCGAIVTSAVSQQPQPSLQQVGKGSNLIGNMMHFQQLPSGSFAMNMLMPSNGQDQAYVADSVRADQEIKCGQGAIKPLLTQGILAAVSQTGDIGSQIQLPVASMVPSSLPNVAHCNPDGNTVLLNNFGPRMIMNAPIPPVSVSVMTNVSKSLTQVVPAMNINQTVFNTHQIAHQLLGTQQNGAQIINTGAPTPRTHIINTSPQGAQLVTTTPQGAQFMNPTAAATQLVGSTPQTSQIMNALSVQGLNNQLLIANQIQQVSPSNSLSQLSPAMAAHILTQGRPHLQQMSPSFLQNQLHKQNSVLNGQNIFASVSLPALTVTSGGTDSSISQAGVISGHLQKNPQAGDTHDNMDITKSLAQVKDTSLPLSNTSVYAATSQPVFVIPQPNSNPLMQVLGSAHPLTTTSGLASDLSVQQGHLSQMLGQSPAVDQSQIQKLLAAGFNPLALQQMVNAFSLSGVQQQQQLQILQLQQLMLQQLQNHGQNIQGISLPLNQQNHGQNIQGISLPLNQQNPSASQATTLGAPTIMNAIMPQQGLQLNSVMDINTLHPCLSPVAQGYQNQLSPAAAQLQHISSALTVQQMTSINSCGTVGVVQNGSMQNLIQTPSKHLKTSLSLQPQPIFSDLASHSNQNPITDPPTTPSHEPQKNITTQAQQLTAGRLKSPVTTVTVTKPIQPNKPKPKSKSKKVENKKVIDPESERNEEDIAATVQQILAQAVQQQKELSLAAKNQPPPPPKSKSKKSQARSKVHQAPKEHDLGKLASISDDVAITRSEDLRLKDKVFEASPTCSGHVKQNHFTLVSTKCSSIDVRQSLTTSQPNSIIFPSPGATPPHSCHPFSGSSLSSPAATSFVEQTLNETNFMNCNAKKSSISLKDHLSSIISKDKDIHNKKAPSGNIQCKGHESCDTKINHTIQPTAVINGEASFHPKIQR